MGRAGRVNVKRKEVEIATAINQAQLRRPTGVRRRSKKLRRNVLDGADFVRDVPDTYLQVRVLRDIKWGISSGPRNQEPLRSLLTSRLPITNTMVRDPLITNAVANPQQIPCRPGGLTRRLASAYRGQSP